MIEKEAVLSTEPVHYKRTGGFMAPQLLKNSMNAAARYENLEVKAGVNCLQKYKFSTTFLDNEQIL